MKAIAKKKTKVTLQAFINWMWTEFQGTVAQMTEDKKLADKDMHKFLTWGDNACSHAAYHKWLGIYLDAAKQWNDKKKTAEEFLQHLSINLLQEAAIVPSSSGSMHRLMETCDRAARARIVNELQQALKFNTFL